MNKIIEQLNLDDDFLFAKVMSDKEICKKVLEKILKIKINSITMPEQQKVIDILLDSKAVRLDIYVHDENNTIYNVEMQKGKRKNLPKRSRYYQGSIDLDMISKGKDYKELQKSFVIFICTFDPFKRGRHLYTFENRCIEDNTLLLGDETTKLFLNTKGTLNDVDEEMLEFLKYIEESTDEVAGASRSQLVKVINDKVKHLKEDKSMEVEYMTLLERDKEKFQEGREEGREEGILEANREIAKKMLSKGMSIQDIAAITELSIEEIAAINTAV
ncbi:MAG: Rpn family recombination-promoting nuclease/putative transposase [Cellulosilyticaceae bacterium]